MGNKYIKMILNITNHQGNAIKTTMRYHLTHLTPHTSNPNRSIIKKTRDNQCWQGCEEKETLAHYWWEFKVVNH